MDCHVREMAIPRGNEPMMIHSQTACAGYWPLPLVMLPVGPVTCVRVSELQQQQQSRVDTTMLTCECLVDDNAATLRVRHGHEEQYPGKVEQHGGLQEEGE